MKSFKEYLNEMAIGQFNWKEKPIGHINDFDDRQVQWVYKMMTGSDEKSKNFQRYRKFTADDGSGNLTQQQVLTALKIRLSGKKVAPTSVHQPVTAEGDDFTPKAHEPKTDPVASKIIKRLKESNNLLSRLADYFGSPKYFPSTYQKNKAEIETSIRLNLNAINSADAPALIARLKKFIHVLFNLEPKGNYKLRIDYHDELQHVEMLIYDVLGDEAADL